MAPSTTVRRLLKEVAELSPNTPNPNPAFYAAPVSDSDLHEWHFTLLGPPSPSPYVGGLYHGRISLPSQYPLKPPNFRFLTPTGRFEVNREICLSISGFHEETWMPAWGVRTALTALRSFMSEAGTAGQVGGLEATDETRKRLASESKSWKCNECGKTNKEVMDEWWKICRDKGVKVDEEGMGLEALPDGMAVEVIDRSKGKAAAQDKQGSGAQVKVAETIIVPEHTAQSAPQQTIAGSQTSSEIESSSKELSVDPTSQQSQADSQLKPTPTIPLSSSSRTHQSTEQHLRDEASVTQEPPPPTPSQLPQPPSQLRQNNEQHQQQQPVQTITLDRAITAVFLALCIMIIKRIFYPSSSPFGFNTTSDNGNGGASTREEWEIGLRREY